METASMIPLIYSAAAPIFPCVELFTTGVLTFSGVKVRTISSVSPSSSITARISPSEAPGRSIRVVAFPKRPVTSARTLVLFSPFLPITRTTSPIGERWKSLSHPLILRQLSDTSLISRNLPHSAGGRSYDLDTGSSLLRLSALLAIRLRGEDFAVRSIADYHYIQCYSRKPPEFLG